MNYKSNEQKSLATSSEQQYPDVFLEDANCSHEIISTATIAINHSKKMPIAGYGRCKACPCKGYISKHDNSHECKTCGHHYDRHYSA